MVLHFVKISCVKRNLYFPDYYYSFNTSNSQIIAVFSTDCNHLKEFVIETTIFELNDTNHTQLIVDGCIQVVNPLYSAITNKSISYHVYQHFAYYTNADLKITQSQYNDNLTFNLVNNTTSLIHHLFLYNLSNFTDDSIDSLMSWVNKLSNNTAKNSMMRAIINGFDEQNNNTYVQALVSNSVVFHFNDIDDSDMKPDGDSFMYDQCGTIVRLNIASTQYPDLIKENQTVVITYWSDVMELFQQEIVEC